MVHLDETPPPNLDHPDWPQDCRHRPADARDLGYLAWHAMADARVKRGERQVWCLSCKRWRWPTTPCTEPSSKAEPRAKKEC